MNYKGSIRIMRDRWAEFRKAISDGLFSLYDVSTALKDSVSLHVLDDLIQNTRDIFGKSIVDVLGTNASIVRAARIQNGDQVPDYKRFIPDAKFIKGENRFSPPGVEWLYLAFADRDPVSNVSVHGLRPEDQCALKECRAVAGDTFALCNFELNDMRHNNLLIDLTIAESKSFDELESNFVENYRSSHTRKEQRDYIRAWMAQTYAKIFAEQIFLPVESEDKSLMYAPFQCMAQYFLSEGYCGIVYGSTVFPGGKNVVLFDKEIAHPCGEIRQITIPSDF